MFKKTISYYIQTSLKRFWAYYYFVKDKIFRSSFNNKSIKILEEYERNETKYYYKLCVNNSYFYPYAYFNNPIDIEDSIKKNKDGYVIGFKGYTSDIPLLLYTAYYGLLCHNNFLNHKKKEDKEIILKYATYIINQMNSDGAIIYPIDFAIFNQKTPWHSGIAQAIVASFLMRAHLHFPEYNFLEYSEKSINFMLNDEKLQASSNENLPWIEEYPMEKPSLVLNGFMFSIISLIELGGLTEKKKYNDVSHIYLSSLIKSLHRYLFSEGIRHNLYQIKFGNVNYDALHVFLFYHLFHLTQNKLFLKISNQYFYKTDWNLFYQIYSIKDPINRKLSLENYYKNLNFLSQSKDA